MKAWLRLLLFVLCVPGPASAQQVDSFDHLADVLNAGDRIRVVDWSGRAVQATLVALTPDYIAVNRHGSTTERVARADVREVSTRRHDSLGNGGAIGFVTASVVTCVAIGAAAGNSRCTIGAAVLLGGLGAGIGMLIDAAVSRRVVVFRSAERPVTLSVQPTRAGLSLAAAVGW